MKRIMLFSVITLVCFSTKVNAQTSYGAKGGVNFSNMFIEDVNDNNMKIGFNLGVFARAYLSDAVTLQPELNFTTKGSTVTYDYLLGTGETSYNFNYIEIPVLLGVEIADAFRIHAGPYVGFLVSGNVVNDASDDALDFDEPIDRDDFNSTEIGLAGGAGFGSGKFELGLRYNYGLTEIGKTDSFNGLSYSLRNAHHSVWQIYGVVHF